MEEAIARIAVELPDIVLIDIGLPRMSGIEGISILKERYPNIQLLVLTVHGDDKRIFEALRAGACGYLLKKTPPARLLESIREAMTGGAPMSPEVARSVIQLFQQFRPPSGNVYELSPHEARVLKLMAEGHNYHTAASELGVSINTIRFHVRSIYEKLQVHSKSEAVAKGLRQGIIH